MAVSVGAVAGSGARMGDADNDTPPMIRINVLLPHDLVAAIDELVGQSGRSSFLTEAARESLKRRHPRPFLPSDEFAWESNGPPESADGSDAFVHGMRDDGEDSDRARRGYW